MYGQQDKTSFSVVVILSSPQLLSVSKGVSSRLHPISHHHAPQLAFVPPVAAASATLSAAFMVSCASPTASVETEDEPGVREARIAMNLNCLAPHT